MVVLSAQLWVFDAWISHSKLPEGVPYERRAASATAFGMVIIIIIIIIITFIVIIIFIFSILIIIINYIVSIMTRLHHDFANILQPSSSCPVPE